MKTIFACGLLALLATGQLAGQQIGVPGLNWADSYTFDRFNQLKIDFYAKGDELMRTFNYKIFYTGDGLETTTTSGGFMIPKQNFSVFMDAPNKGSDVETIFDMTNEVAIQIFGSDAAEPMYNAGRFKFPEGADLKRLELVPTDETRTIAGHPCRKYTYTHKKIFGSVWIAGEVKIPNDLGIFRAAKMAALHNTLSGEGFVVEMTSEDAKGGRTVMTTVSLGNIEKHTVSLPKEKVGTAINKVSYFSF